MDIEFYIGILPWLLLFLWIHVLLAYLNYWLGHLRLFGLERSSTDLVWVDGDCSRSLAS